MKLSSIKLLLVLIFTLLTVDVRCHGKVKELEDNDNFQCYIDISVSDNNLLVNQETLLKVKIYTNDTNIANVHYTPFKISGLEFSPKNLKGKWSKEKYKGKEMSCFVLAEYFIGAEKAGTYLLGGEDCVVERYTIEQVYDRFWGYSNRKVMREYSAKMNEIKLKVKKIPEEFKNLPIGEFDINAKVAPGYIKPGDDALILVTVEGYGSLVNANLNDVKQLCENHGIELKQVKKNINRYVKNDKTWHEMEFEVWVKAPDSGVMDIPPFQFDFLDSETKKKKTIKSAPLIINPGETVKENEKENSKPKVIQAI